MNMIKLSVRTWLREEPFTVYVSSTCSVEGAAEIAAAIAGLDTRGSAWGLQGDDEVPIAGHKLIAQLPGRDFELTQTGGTV